MCPLRVQDSVVTDKRRWPHFASLMTNTCGDPSRHNVAVCTELLQLTLTRSGAPNFLVTAECFPFRA